MLKKKKKKKKKTRKKGQCLWVIFVTRSSMYLAVIGLLTLYLSYSLEGGPLTSFIFVLLLLLSHFSRVWLCATPWTAAHQAPLSLGFSRQEHWSGGAISFSNAWKWTVKVKSLSCVRLLATPWTAVYQAPLSMGFFPGKSTGVGCHCLLRYLCSRNW